jgi:hypothetical protein
VGQHIPRKEAVNNLLEMIFSALGFPLELFSVSTLPPELSFSALVD